MFTVAAIAWLKMLGKLMKRRALNHGVKILKDTDLNMSCS